MASFQAQVSKLMTFNKLSAAVLAVSVMVSVGGASAKDASTHAGRARVYEALKDNSLERVTTADALATELGLPNVAPTRIWKLLEHGEKVECLDCISTVSKLLYDSHPKTREISAWWLRRRIFGVFGPGQIYSQILSTATDQSRSETQRSYAVNALGEFLDSAGIKPVATALSADGSAKVRLAAVNALLRLNNEGPNGELGQALYDEDESVRLAALHASTSVNVFSDTDSLLERFTDDSAAVRRRAAEVVGTMRLADAVMGLIRLASEDLEPSADVRGAAVWALGQIANPAAKAAVQAASKDSSTHVQNSARIALRRL